MSPVNGTACAGVDLNRNFDVNWNEVITVEPLVNPLYADDHYSGHLPKMTL